MRRWRRATPKTDECVRLDLTAYPSVAHVHWQIPWPAWACKGPDGGVHIDARVGQIDIRVAEPPSDRFEINWTRNFGVHVVARRWLSELGDLIDGTSVFAGRLFCGSVELERWATLTSIQPPPLRCTEGHFKRCSTCGSVHTVIWGKTFFDRAETEGRKIFVNQHGIFIHEAEWSARNLRAPEGSFRPSWVTERASPPAMRKNPFSERAGLDT